MDASSSLRPDFYGFLDRMRRPAASDLVRDIKSFIVSFSFNPINAEEASKRVQEFLLTMEIAIKDHILWSDASYEEIDNAIEGLEKFVMTKLFDQTFASSPEDRKIDSDISEKIRLLQYFINPNHLDVPRLLHNEASWLFAVKELQKINTYRAPREKLMCVMNYCQVINNLLLNASESVHGTERREINSCLFLFISLSRKFMMINRELEERKEEKIFPIFVSFRAKVAELDELVQAGKEFFVRFTKLLGYFQRPEINKDLKMINQIIESNLTMRMKSYLEARCTHSYKTIQNISQLHSCELGLRDYIQKAKTLLDEIESLAGNAYKIALESNQNIPNLNLSQNNLDNSSMDQEDEEQELYVINMKIIFKMLKLDYTMQDKIVGSLSINTPSSELESYNIMWDLRPYVNDDIMHRAWKSMP